MEAKLKLEYAERDLKEMASIKEQLLQKQEEIMQLQNQLQEEKFNRWTKLTGFLICVS